MISEVSCVCISASEAIAVDNLYFSVIKVSMLCTSHLKPPPPPPPPHPRTYGEGWGIAGLKCGAITFRVSPQCRGSDGVLTLGSIPPGRFSIAKSGQRAKF